MSDKLERLKQLFELNKLTIESINSDISQHSTEQITYSFGIIAIYLSLVQLFPFRIICLTIIFLLMLIPIQIYYFLKLQQLRQKRKELATLILNNHDAILSILKK